MLGESPSLDPREFVRRFRDSYVNFFLLWKRVARPEGVELRTPAEAPISEAKLPEPLRQLLAAERRALGGEAPHFYKYLRVENGSLVRVIEDERGLPDEEDLLSLSHTVTLLTGSTVRVVTEVFVAHLHPRR